MNNSHTVDSLATGRQGNYASLSLSAISGMDYRLLNFTCGGRFRGLIFYWLRQ